MKALIDYIFLSFLFIPVIVFVFFLWIMVEIFHLEADEQTMKSITGLS